MSNDLTIEHTKGGRIFYPEVSKAFDKWIKNACDNPMIMADPSFESYLAGWQAALKWCEYSAVTPTTDNSK